MGRVKKLEIQSKSDIVWSASAKEHEEKVRWEKTMKKKMSNAGDEIEKKHKAEEASKKKLNKNEEKSKKEEKQKKKEEKQKKTEEKRKEQSEKKGKEERCK